MDTDDAFDKIDGDLMPGSHVTAHLTDGRALHGYVFMPEGATAMPFPSDVVLQGWVHFPEVDTGSSNEPVRMSLEGFLELGGIERIEVVSVHVGEDWVWHPGCLECEAVGRGEVTNWVHDAEHAWKCLNCEATFDEPRRIPPEDF